MTDLQRALIDVRSIRRQVAETTEFRGYGPVTLTLTGAVALAAGVAQALWVQDPAGHPWTYVMLWLSVAVICAAMIGTEMLARARRLHSGLADEMVSAAVRQFLPAGLAGALLPFALLGGPLRGVPELVGLLPGLWQILFSLGVFACCRTLPKAMLGVGLWFLVTGMACLVAGPGFALSSAGMSAPFAVGMMLVAAIHFRSHRRRRLEVGHGD